MTEGGLQKECEERQHETDLYIQQHYGDSIGPRRRSHWEVCNGELCLVEE